MDYKVSIFEASDPKLKRLRADKSLRVLDLFEHCLDELFDVQHPWLKSGDPVYEPSKAQYLLDWKQRAPLEKQGVWVYYPWNNTLIHLPSRETFQLLRTCRNRNLVTREEQTILMTKRIGVAGMSVGSNILNVLAMSGVGGGYKIADFDTISVPNLNRLMAPLWAVDMHKGLYFAQRTLELDPFLEVELYDKGLLEENMADFFLAPKLDLFIEEVDNAVVKLKSRLFAREHGIPLIMATDNGDGIFVDVERYDLEPDLIPFHGRASQKLIDSIRENMSFAERLALVSDIAGLSEATPRMQDSIQEVGTFLNTWPQLGTAAVTAGTATTFVAKRILLGQEMPTGRYYLAQEDAFVPGHSTQREIDRRASHTAKTMTGFRGFQKYLQDLGDL